jgi:hypothetical protein
MKNYKYFLIITSLVITLASCDEKMVEMNTDPLALSSLPAEYLFSNAVLQTFGDGSYISPFHLRFASQYAHVYVTNSEMRSADQYNDFHTQDSYKEMFTVTFVGPLRYINEVLQMTAEGGDQADPVKHAMADIVAVVNFAQASDCWGDIPYFEGAKGDQGVLYPVYDKQQIIYADMMERLKSAISVLKTAGPDDGFPGADPVYDNDLSNWIRFANSLRFRMAMKIRFADPSTSTKVISECMVEPLIETNEQNFERTHLDSEDPDLYNPWFDIRKYQNYKMSDKLTSWLAETNDPRLYIFVDTNSSGQRKGVLNGLNDQAYSQVDWNQFSNPTPLLYSKALSQYLLCASEVCFLKAEAALFNLAPGDAEQLYQDGIRLNMELWKIDQNQIQNFISTEPEATLSGDQENKFRQIETQAWIAFIPNFTEAWVNIRRTGYPDIPQRVNTDIYSLGVTNGVLPSRFKYASSEYLNNLANVTAAVNNQGPDLIDTRVWWDVRGK